MQKAQINKTKKSGINIYTVSHPKFRSAFVRTFYTDKELNEARDYAEWLTKLAEKSV